MLLSTCTMCLDGFHRRCEDRHECLCSICTRPTPQRKSVMPVEEVTSFEVPREDLHHPEVTPKGWGGPPSLAPRRPRGRPITDFSPEAVERREQHRLYVQAWRARRELSEEYPRQWTAYTDEQKAEALRLRQEEGLTFRAIGERLGLDYSGLAKHIKQMEAAQ